MILLVAVMAMAMITAIVAEPRDRQVLVELAVGMLDPVLDIVKEKLSLL